MGKGRGKGVVYPGNRVVGKEVKGGEIRQSKRKGRQEEKKIGEVEKV